MKPPSPAASAASSKSFGTPLFSGEPEELGSRDRGNSISKIDWRFLAMAPCCLRRLLESEGYFDAFPEGEQKVATPLSD